MSDDVGAPMKVRSLPLASLFVKIQKHYRMCACVERNCQGAAFSNQLSIVIDIPGEASFHKSECWIIISKHF